MSPLWTRLVALGVTGALLASCSSTPAPSTTPSKSTTSSGPAITPGRTRMARPVGRGRLADPGRRADAALRTVQGQPYTVLGKTYFPISDGHRYSATGTASWYGTKFHGQPTANGEKYDLYGMSAAHKTLPLPTYVKVTNTDNGRTVTLRVNDRGPFYSDRIIDLSFAAAKKLGFAETGTARVKVEGIDPQQWWAAQGARSGDDGAAADGGEQAGHQHRPADRTVHPPPQQHAAATVPLEIDAKNASPAASGLFLRVGAFANPDAAQLLKDKLSGVVSAPVFISSVVHNQQTLHRVRLGPIDTPDEAVQLEQSVRLANLGQPRRVAAD